ncbi:MAG: type 11 methyltransferase [Candidatus Roseilinea sp.]|nr:MAG: type 11 methyltransferase [Candidatus Roseilinea sp.]
MSDLIQRIQAALQSGEAAKRGAHFLVGHALHALPASLRRWLYRGTQHYCPLCSSDLSTFLKLHRDFFAFCPVCWSLQRHRLIWLFLQQQSLLSNHVPLRLLHIAPEPALAAKFRAIAHIRYISADLHDPRAMERMDINDIRHPAGAFDATLCSHVLEHVADDRRAMRELHRVLVSGGWALILAPAREGPTIEDPTIKDPNERERRFGQHDHVRIYGYTDLMQRLRNAGFNVEVYTSEQVASPRDVQRFGLSPSERLWLCWKE